MGVASEQWGIDGRLLALIPVSTMAASGILTYLAGVQPEDAGIGIAITAYGAVLMWPVTLPCALVGWVWMWHALWLARVREPLRAIGAGIFAGVTTFGGIWFATVLSGAIRVPGALTQLFLAATLGGFAAALLIYWRGWFAHEGV